jgi:hypothetical protein
MTVGKKSLWCVAAFAGALALGAGFVACGGGNGAQTNAGDDGGGSGDSTTGDTGSGGDGNGSKGDGPVQGDGGLAPDVFNGNGNCLKLGVACKSGGDCCTGTCTNGVCDYPACTSDNGACTTNGDCCSQTCTAGKCAALNTTCETLGNQCTSSGECCSGRCASGTCQPSSFCGQAGDICAHNSDCCTSQCTIASGQTVGTCGGATGTHACGLTDGQLCNGTAPDGGIVYIDGGLPVCGGSCCSRACAPWGPTGAFVCQPASGCHVEGDICNTDSDCCGAAAFADAGLPSSGHSVTCTNGSCTQHQGCTPAGDVCHLGSGATGNCNANADCCNALGNNGGACKQDNLGIPRCSTPTCVNPSGACASSADCCNGQPCVPNPGGSPPYVCYTQACVPSCGTCSTSADCCAGFACNNGVCDPCGGDGGTTTGGDGGTTGGGCAMYGQLCTTSSDCCNGVPCTLGRCEYPIQ